MDETRRGFLKAMMTATVAAVAAAELGDPEALLWTPQKKIFDLGARPALEAPTLSEMAQIFMDPHAGGLIPKHHSSLEPIYMPDRFTFATGSGYSMTFDSDFRPMTMNGRKLTAQQKADIAADMARSQRDVLSAFRTKGKW